MPAHKVYVHLKSDGYHLRLKSPAAARETFEEVRTVVKTIAEIPDAVLALLQSSIKPDPEE